MIRHTARTIVVSLALGGVLLGGLLVPAEAASATTAVDAPAQTTGSTQSPLPSESATPTPTPSSPATDAPVPTPPAVDSSAVTSTPTPTPTSTPTAPPASDPSRSGVQHPTTVQCYGSSSSEFLCDGYLGKTLPGWTVLRKSMWGTQPTSIGVTGGAYQTSLGRTITIPAAGSVNLQSVAGLPVPESRFGLLSMNAEIAGVRGSIMHNPDSDASKRWVFTRSDRGAVVTAPAGTPINSLDKPLPGSTVLLWIGANGIDDEEAVKETIRRMVALSEQVGATSYVVQLAPRLASHYQANVHRLRVNAWIHDTYGDRAIPLADYLNNGALTDAGRVPNQYDAASMLQGYFPNSFWAAPNDTTHLNALGNTVVARYFARWIASGYTYSQAVARFDVASTAEVRVEGQQLVVSGHAFDPSDLYRTIDVGITVNGEWSLRRADAASPQLRPFGVPASHGYRAVFDVAPGTYRVCSVGVNVGAGKDSFPPCTTVTVAPVPAPVGDMVLADTGSPRVKQVFGWTYTDRLRSKNVDVAITVDGKWSHLVSANRPSPYLQGVPGQHAFWTTVTLPPGSHRVCAVAIDSSALMTNLGCRSVTAP